MILRSILVADVFRPCSQLVAASYAKNQRYPDLLKIEQ